MAKYKYVIIGGGVAGGSAAEGIRQIDETGTIALVTKEPHPPYQRPPLSKSFLRGNADLERLYLRDYDYYRENRVEILNALEVLRVDPDQQQIHLEDGVILEYELLLLATGGDAIRLDIPGNSLKNVYTLRTIADARSIQQACREGETALIMGGSFIGVEVAASLAEMGINVIQIFPQTRLLERIVPEEVSNYLLELFNQNGIRILPQTVAKSFEGETKVERVILNNGEKIEIDLVVMGVGIRLNTDLAKEAGLEMQKNDRAIIVDQRLRTSDPNIYAAGDIAAWPDARFEGRLQVEHWDVARSQGKQAGRNMAGENQSYSVMPYFFSDMFDLSFEVWGDLSKWNQTVIRGKLENDSFAVYYFDRDNLCAILSIGRPDAERDAMQKLVNDRPKYGSIASKIQDEQTNLDKIAGIKSNETNKSDNKGAPLSFSEDIAPYFRKMDIEEMKDISGLDLSDYEDVKSHANNIYDRLADQSMPCDEPWPKDQIDKFKSWIESGMQP